MAGNENLTSRATKLAPPEEQQPYWRCAGTNRYTVLIQIYLSLQILKPKSLLLTLLCLLSFQLNAQNSEISVRLLHDNNVGFTPNFDKSVSDSVLRVGGERTWTKRLSPFSQVSVTGLLDINEYRNYACDHIDIGLQAAYIRKLGLGLQAPRLIFGLLGESRNYDVNLRDVFVSNVSIGLSKPISERIDLAFNLSAETHRVKEDQTTPKALKSQLSQNAFDRDFMIAELSSLTYLDSNWSMPISISVIDGDLVSISRPNRTILAGSLAANDYSEIMPGAIAYRSEGRANSIAIGLNRSLTDRSALRFLYTHQSGEASDETKYSRDLLSFEYNVNW